VADAARLFIVEDEPIIAADLRYRLQSFGYEVVGQALSGEEALAKIEALAPDLIFMDIHIVGLMDGIDVALEVKRRWRYPVVFLTAYSEEGTLERAKTAEPYGYIMKPFQERELRTIVEIALYRRGSEEKIRQLQSLNTALSQVNQAIVWSRDREALFLKIIEVLTEFGHLEKVDITWRGTGEPFDPTLAEQAVSANQAVLPDSSKPPYRSRAAFPIRLQNQPVGALCVYSSQPGFFQLDEIRLLDEVAMDISYALENFEREDSRSRAERDLQSSRRTLQLVLENFPGQVFWKGPDRTFLGANTAFAHAANRQTAEEIVGLKDDDLEDAAAVERHLAEDKLILEQGQPVTNVVQRRPRNDGSQGWFETGKFPLWDEEGKVAGIVGFSRDITEQIEAEEKLFQYQENLDKLVKQRTRELAMAREVAESASRSKSLFLAKMSHEIRTPMNAIIGMTQLALRTEVTRQQADYLQKTLTASQSLLVIINDILDFSKIEAGKLDFEEKPFALAEVLNHAEAMIAGKAADKGLEFVLQLEDEVPERLVGDPTRLGQVLVNLLGNAVKFTDHGQVRLSIGKVTESPDAVELRFVVSDTGMGISPETVETLFKPFEQGQSEVAHRYGGTGLGLAISRQLVELMGGDIRLESKRGEGSTFRFTARFRPAPAPAADHEPAAASPPAAVRCLVIDDHPIPWMIQQKLLASDHFSMEIVPTGEEGLVLIEQAMRSRPYNLLIVDWMLPGMDGFAVREKVLALPGLPEAPKMLLITANNFKNVHERARERGFDGFLVKPVQSRDLEAAIRTAFSEDTPQHAAAASLHAKVLLAEDNEFNQEIALENLRQAGLEVTLARDGAEAVELWEQGHFDVILMDIQMPRMDGFEASRRIRASAKGASVPIIAMTAFASASDRERCLAAGMSDFLTKPIDLKEMVSTLSRWLGVEKPDPKLPAEWPASLPGISLERGLGHLGNNVALYKKLLVKFRKEESRAAQLDETLARGDRNQAMILVHTLKSVSASLGAIELSDVCKELETAFREPQGDASREAGLVSRFKTELDRVVRGIEGAFAEEAAPAASGTATPELVRRIGEQLEQNFPEALELQRRLSALVEPGSAAADSVRRLKDAMELYQIKTAKDELAVLGGLLESP
jgi:PAS domain S-box-containing protein